MQTIAKQERRALVDKAISFRNCQKEKGPSSPQWEENGGNIATNRFVYSVAGKSRASSRQIIIIGPYLLLIRYIVRGTPDESASNFSNKFA